MWIATDKNGDIWIFSANKPIICPQTEKWGPTRDIESGFQLIYEGKNECANWKNSLVFVELK